MVWLVASGRWTDATPAALALDGAKEGGATFFDLDGDGDLDLVSPGGSGVHVLRADGGLAFTDVTLDLAPELLALADPTRGLLAADLTHDGATDLVRVGATGAQVLVNSGPPSFALTTAFAVDAPSDLGFEGSAILDADGDGWLDVLIAAAAAGNELLVNPADGSVAFAVVDQAPLGMVPSGDNSDYATVGDWDFDGDPDVVVRGAGTGPDAFLRDGDGWVATSLDLDGANAAKGAVALCDVRGLGLLDLHWSSPLAPAVRAFTWAGDWQELSFEPGFWPTGPRSVDCVDIDDDGALDLWLTDDDDEDVFHGPDYAYEAVGNEFVDTAASAFADVDGDGDQDVYLVHDGLPNQLLLNGVDDERTLLVALRRNVGTCEAPILRDDFGGWARLVGGPLVELSGGRGRGQTATPWLHFGLDPAVDHTLDVRLGREPTFALVVPAGTRELVIRDDDPDGDGLVSDRERTGDGGDLDTDGDSVPDHIDADADGDGRSDADEAGATPCASLPDSDADGVPDVQDPDDPATTSAPTEPTPTGPDPPGVDSDGDGVVDAVDPDPQDAGGVLEAPPDAPDGCGCASGPGLPWPIVAVLAVRRRRSALGARRSAR